MPGRGRIRERAQRVSRALLGAYLLVLFTPVSITANLSLCVCDQCSKLESTPLGVCGCALGHDPAPGAVENCPCCQGPSLVASDSGSEDSCASIMLPAWLSSKFRLPAPRCDTHCLALVLHSTDAPLPQPAYRLGFSPAQAARPPTAEISTVRLLM